MCGHTAHRDRHTALTHSTQTTQHTPTQTTQTQTTTTHTADTTEQRTHTLNTSRPTPFPVNNSSATLRSLIFRQRSAVNDGKLRLSTDLRERVVKAVADAFMANVTNDARRARIDETELASKLFEMAWRIASKLCDGEIAVPDNLRGFARTVTRRTALSLQRREIRDRHGVEVLMGEAETRSWDSPAADHTLEGTTVGLILTEISADDQLVMILPLAGYSDIEIGSLMERQASPGAVAVRRNRVRKRLSSRLKDFEGGMGAVA